MNGLNLSSSSSGSGSSYTGGAVGVDSIAWVMIAEAAVQVWSWPRMMMVMRVLGGQRHAAFLAHFLLTWCGSPQKRS